MLSVARAETQISFEALRAREFSRLDVQDLAYLDYAGSALYGESQLRAHHALLSEGVFGNPHSDSGPSHASTEIIDTARRRVLQFLDVDESTHDVCFTANTSAAIKLVAESYPFQPESTFLLSADNHNSVNGIREYARRGGARVRYIPLDDELRLLDAQAIIESESDRGGLLAFPAQSNFSGVRHPLAFVAKAKSRGFDVLLDLAAYVP
ncbi:MAG TPA: aminotransferase class V-fold PLP-dependent enzyme, partial [Thermoanaerobaculia bacterium]|nr:aminotransferase class V-fold PLP-dependent enzyme [Thermoanaerobaculia bacterium]